MPPDLLLAGHVVKDIVAGGWRPGGCVTYAAAQGQRLGLRVAAVTSCAADVRPEDIVPGVEWRVVPSEATTTFENRYVAGRREQRVLARANSIRSQDIPEDWRPAPLVLLGPVYHDVEPGLAKELQSQDRIVGVAAQGWLRRLRDGQVVVEPAMPPPGWLGGDTVFVSEEDVQDPENVGAWQARTPIVVLTRARRGCTVWDASGRHDLPAFETKEVDPTGAGDVFATAFLFRLRETGDSLEAARFGAAAAALAIRRPGLEGIAGREEIEAFRRAQQALRSR